MPARNALLRSIVLGATLTCIGGAAAFAAPNPNTYLNGTYLIVNLDASMEGDQIIATFDGAGNYSATEIRNTGGVITSGANSGTYAVASNGTFTLDPGSPDMITGAISADGNTFVANLLVAGQN